jgi:DNA-binding NarL/FixJ family response regulator
MEVGVLNSEHYISYSMGEEFLSVLLVEDSALLSERLKEILTNVSGVSLTATVDTEATAIDALHTDAIDVIVLDLHLRQGTGFGVLREVRKMPKRPAVIVFTNFDLAEYRRAASALGAEYFLDKTRDFERLPAVLAEIRSGQAPTH